MRDFFIRLSAFILLLVLLQFLASIAFPVEIPSEILRLDGYLKDEIDVLYFGDSTLSYPVGGVTTGRILQEMLPDYTVGEISHPAYGLDLYLRYVEYSVRGGHRPHTIIIPINMRSFSPEWDMRPSYQFEKEKRILTYGLFLSRIFLRPLEVFGAFQPAISQDVFQSTTVYNGDTPVGTVRDFEDLADEDALERLRGDAGFVYHDILPSEDDEEALQQALIYRYMYGLNKDHRKLQGMLEMAELCTENDTNVIFYITSVNYQRGERFLGSAFSERFSENAGLAKSLLAANSTANVTVLDLGFGLEAYAFVDMEHLREIGKTYVAEQLAMAIGPELFIASSDTDSRMTPTIPPFEPPTAEPTAVSTPVGPLPLPTVTELAPTVAETQEPTTPTVTVAELSPTPTVTELAPTVAEAQEPATPTVAAANPSPTPTEPSPTAAAALPTPTEPSPSATVSVPVPTTVGTSKPVATAIVSPTLTPTEPSPTRVADSRVSGGTVVSTRHLAYLQPEGKYSVDMYRLRYQTLDENDQLVETRADIYIPRVEITTSFPVLVHAAGTTGLSSECAPLNERTRNRNWGNYSGHALAYAAQGYIAILPNWLGFDDPNRTHPYFVAKLQAHVLLDAARAAYDFLDHAPADDVLAQPTEAVFFMGYSSGGHAVFAAKDLATTYAPELSVKGVIGHGPTTNVETLLREDPIFSPYIIYAYRDFYGSEVIDPADVFLPKWVPTFDSDVLNKCVDDVFGYYSRSARSLYSPAFRNILFNNKLAESFPLFAEKLEANYTGVSGGPRIPVLILQGTGDTVVTPPSQKEFVGQLCALGNSVTYLEYTAVPHVEIRWTSLGDTLLWMQHIAEGGTPESDCADSALQRRD